jgi:hypothetical protein
VSSGTSRLDRPRLVKPLAARASRFQFSKHSQLFIRSHNESLSVIAMRVCNEDCSPARIHGCNTAPTPPGFAEFVSDDFPVLHTAFGWLGDPFSKMAQSPFL